MLLEEGVKIAIALLMGIIIGAERAAKEKPVGMRTISLVTMGATIATIVSIKYFPKEGARILAGIITGIGFLGAGSIMSKGLNVKGLTTAAAIWASAILGIVIGFGEYVLAIVSLIFMIIALKILNEDYVKSNKPKKKKDKKK
jgi:putative Mg2+ transporter-C (MgtC) family protein